MKPIRVERGSHFDAHHFRDTSTFSSNFPVDVRRPDVGTFLTQLPDYVETIFLNHGVRETAETNNNGKIPLQPSKTGLVIERLDDSERRMAHGRHLILQALTNGAEITHAQLQFDVENSAIKALSVFVHGKNRRKKLGTELRAVVNDPYENIYEVAQFVADKEVDSFEVDEDSVSQFFHALRENHAGKELPRLPLEAGLHEMLDSSPAYTKTQSQEFDVPNYPNIDISIEHTRQITRGVARTCRLAVELQETAEDVKTESQRNFAIYYDEQEVNPYTARLGYMLRDLDGSTPVEKRLAIFEDLSTHLRDNPELLFLATQAALEPLLSLD